MSDHRQKSIEPEKWLKAEGIRSKEQKDSVQFTVLAPCALNLEPR
jgi:hypothetical protein